MKRSNWWSEIVVIIAALAIACLIVLTAIDKISKRIDAQVKARAAYSEIQQ